MLDRERLKKTTKLLDEFRTASEFESFTKNRAIVRFLLYLCCVDSSERVSHKCPLLDENRIPLYKAEELCEFLMKFGVFCNRYRGDRSDGYLVEFNVLFQ